MTGHVHTTLIHSVLVLEERHERLRWKLAADANGLAPRQGERIPVVPTHYRAPRRHGRLHWRETWMTHSSTPMKHGASPRGQANQRLRVMSTDLRNTGRTTGRAHAATPRRGGK